MPASSSLLVAAAAFAAYFVAPAHAHGPISRSQREWTNWDGLQSCHPSRISRPRTEADVQAAIAGAESVRVAGAGHSFSPIVLVDSTGVILQLDSLDEVFSIRPLDAGPWEAGNESQPATGPAAVEVGAGMRVHQLNSVLASKGLALENTGAIAIQSVAGATSTSTHGTGRDLGSMSTSILAMRLVLANGTVLDATPDHRPDVLRVARAGLGALGVITRVTVRAVPLFKLRRIATPYSLKALLPWVYPDAYQRFARMQWYYTPRTDKATLLLRVPVSFSTPIHDCWNGTSLEAWVDPARDDLTKPDLPGTTGRSPRTHMTPEGPAPAAEGAPQEDWREMPPEREHGRGHEPREDGAAAHAARRAPGAANTNPPTPTGPSITCTDLSYRTLAHQTDDYDLYEEMEIFTHVDHAQELIQGFIEFENSTSPPPQNSSWAPYSLFTGMRYVAADDIPLSMMHDRPTGVVSFITLGNHTRTGPPQAFAHYARALEQMGRQYQGRFHWGKMNWAERSDVVAGWGAAALADFHQIKTELDPNAVMANDYLRQRLG